MTATATTLAPANSRLAPFLALSVAGHVVVLAAFALFADRFGAPRIHLDETPIKASLVRLGTPRDEKLLPQKETPPEPAAASPTVAPAPTAAPVAVPTKRDVPSKDATKALEKAFDTAGKDSALQRAFDSAGRKAAEGAADGDPAGDAAKQEGERYFGLLRSVIQRNYDVSDTIPESERARLTAEVALWIHADGKIANVSLTKPSGNSLFDAAVMGAIKKAAPFTPPPEHLRAELESKGIGFVFRAMK